MSWLHDLVGLKTNNEAAIEKQFARNACDINEIDWYRSTPLHLVAYSGHSAAIFKVLLKNGANVNALDRCNWTPLHWASEFGHATAAEVLLIHGADVNALDMSNWTPLHNATYNGNVATMKILLRYGADIHIKTGYGDTALHWATQKGCFTSVDLLLANGANINARAKCDHSPLHYAAKHCSTAVIEALLNQGAIVNAKTTNDKTPLDLAKSKKNIAAIALFQSFRNVHILVNENKLKELEEEVVKFPTCIHMKTSNGKTALHLSILQRKSSISEMLITAGSDIDETDECGMTLLHHSILRSQISVAEMLITHGSDVNATDKWMRTPLSLAQGNAELQGVCSMLTSRGGNASPTGFHRLTKNFGLSGSRKNRIKPQEFDREETARQWKLSVIRRMKEESNPSNGNKIFRAAEPAIVDAGTGDRR